MPTAPSTYEEIIQKAMGLPNAKDFEPFIRESSPETADKWERGNRTRYLERAIEADESRLAQTQDAEARKGIGTKLSAMQKQLDFLNAGGELAEVPTIQDLGERQPEYYKRLSDGSQLFYEKLPDGSKKYYTKSPEGERVYTDEEGKRE